MIRLYQLYDKEANTVTGTIFAFKRDEPAARAFYDLLNSGDRNMAPVLHPEQFELRHIADQDEDTGTIAIPYEGTTVYSHVRTVCTGREWKDTNQTQKG